MQPMPRRFRRFLQFRLRTLLLFTMLAGAGFGMYYRLVLKPWQDQEAFLEASHELSVRVVVESWGEGRDFLLGFDDEEDARLRKMDRIVEASFAFGHWHRMKDGVLVEPDSLRSHAPSEFGALNELILPYPPIVARLDAALIGECNLRCSRLPALKRLSMLTWNPDRDLLHIARLSQLEWLQIEAAEPISATALGHLLSLEKLEYLSLDSADLLPGDLSCLQVLPRLRVLDLQPCFAHSRADTGLELRDFPALTHVYLQDHLQTRVCLHDLPRLEVLELSNQCYSARDSQSIEIIACPALRVVDLTANKIGDASLLWLCNPPQPEMAYLNDRLIAGDTSNWPCNCPRLERLYLNDTLFTDEGVRLLLPCRSLQVLTLARTRCTAAALEHLRGLPSLRILEIDADLDEQGVAEFRRARPDVQVVRGHRPEGPWPRRNE